MFDCLLDLMDCFVQPFAFTAESVEYVDKVRYILLHTLLPSNMMARNDAFETRLFAFLAGGLARASVAANLAPAAVKTCGLFLRWLG